MGKIRASVVSKAPIEKLYEMGHYIQDHPESCPNIREFKIMEFSKDRTYSKAEWVIQAQVLAYYCTTSWVQENRWDDEALCCRFSLSPDYKGHISRLEGVWQFLPHPRGTEMVIDLDLKIDSPSVTPLIHKLADAVVRKNNHLMLVGLKKRVESMPAAAPAESVSL